MIRLKTEKEIEFLRQGGIILAKILKELSKEIKVGTSADWLDKKARDLMREYGVRPSFFRYKPSPQSEPFPAYICVSVNDVIVHGVPSPNLVFKSGDVVTIDAGVVYKGLFVDSAVTKGVGQLTSQNRKLIAVTKEALKLGIKACRIGNTIGDIGYVISSFVNKQGFTLVEELVGHGVGYEVHEDPIVPNWGKKGQGIRLKKGMVLALEPMVCTGSGRIVKNEDGSFATLDGSVSAHFEHTVAVTEKGPIVITRW